MEEQVEKLLPRIQQFALRLTGHVQMAEDLAQDALLRALQKADQVREPSALKAWVFRITLNLWRDRLRKGHREQTGMQVELSELATRGDTANVETTHVLDQLKRLPERQRMVLYLFAVEEMKAAEISEALGISRQNVRANLSYARKAMREMNQFNEATDDKSSV